MTTRKAWVGLAIVISAFAAASGDAQPGAATAGPQGKEPARVQQVVARYFLAAKDCSSMQSCYDRCQCQYDNCVAACGDTDAACVNTCVANWNGCREYC
jgi:hypothetical protein